MDIKETSQHPVRIDREEYLKRLTTIDRGNLQTVGRLFSESATKKERTGTLFVVGGSITKPLPRKDIDIAVVFEKTPNDFSYKSGFTPYRRALEDFSVFRQVFEQLIIADPNFEIRTVIEPLIDEEFESESILKHDGSITLACKKGGTPIEFIRIEERGADNFIKRSKEPFTLL